MMNMVMNSNIEKDEDADPLTEIRGILSKIKDHIEKDLLISWNSYKEISQAKYKKNLNKLYDEFKKLKSEISSNTPTMQLDIQTYEEKKRGEKKGSSVSFIEMSKVISILKEGL